MTAAQVTANIQTQVLALSGGKIKAAPTYPPDGFNQFPVSVAFPPDLRESGLHASWDQMFETYKVRLIWDVGMMKNAIEEAYPHVELLLRSIRTDGMTLGGTVTTVQDIRAKFIEWQYAGQPVIGWEVEIDVKRTLT